MQGSEERPSSSVDILQRVAAFLRSLTPDEAEDLAAGRAKLTLTTRSRRRPAPRELSPEQVSVVVRDLRELDTRDAGMTYLSEAAPTRATLAQVAAGMDIPIPKSDNVSKLRERIVEAAIGYRLRSDAIRGDNRGATQEQG